MSNRKKLTVYVKVVVAVSKKPEAEFFVGFEGLASTLRIGLAVGRPWSQKYSFLVVASAFHQVGATVLANPIPSR